MRPSDIPMDSNRANSATRGRSRATRYQLHAASVSVAEAAIHRAVASGSRLLGERQFATTLPSSSSAQIRSSASSQADAASLRTANILPSLLAHSLRLFGRL